MPGCWFHEYLQARAKEQFDLDYTFFTSKAFSGSVGKGTLHRFMTSHLLEIFSNKLTHTLQRRGSRCQDMEEPGIALDEVEDAAVPTYHWPCCPGRHETDTPTAGDNFSLEFPNASCEDVDNVISLEDSSVPACAVPESPTEEVLHLEASDIHEDQDMVQSGPSQVCEDPYEPPHANEVETQADAAPEPEYGEQKVESEVSTLDAAAPSMECQAADAPVVPEPPTAEDAWDYWAVPASKKSKKKKKGIPTALVHEEDAVWEKLSRFHRARTGTNR